MANNCTELKKDLGLVTALSLVVGMVLGAGAFMKPSAVLAVTGDTNTALWAWVIGGLLSMAGGLTLCELGVMFPRTGGIFVYLEEIYNKKTAFLYGWVLTFIYGPATIGALVGYFSSVFCLLFNIPDVFAPMVGAGVLAFVLFVNAVSVKRAGNLQTIATFCKLIPLILIVVGGLGWGNGKIFMQSTGLMSVMGPFSAAVLATLFAYDGWAQVASVAGEIKNPGKILPRAIIGGLCFLIIVYLGINMAMFKVLSAAEIVTLGHDAAAVVSQKLFGLVGGNLVAVGIMVSILGGINGYTMTLSRIVYSMGERKQLPGSKFFGKLDCDSRTPVYGAALLIIISFVYYRLFDADKLSDIAVFAIWIFYALSFVAVIIARKKFAHLPRTYKVPLYPVIPIIAVIGAVYCLYGMVQASLINAIMAIVLTLIGLPVYAYLMRDQSGKSGFPAIKSRTIVACVAVVFLGVLYISTIVSDSRPVLKIATSATTKPYMYEEKDGSRAGFEIELMQKLGDGAGYKIQYNAYDFTTMLAAIAGKKIDAAIGMISITDERSKTFAFSKPYYSGQIILAVHPGEDLTKENYSGRKIGVRGSTTGESYANQLSGANIKVYDSVVDMKNAFIDKELYGIVWDLPMLSAMAAGDDKFAFINAKVFAEEKYGIIFREGTTRELEKINKALDALDKSGELQIMKDKWNLPAIK
ncbi:MAG: amino acid permease [Bacillota bacterium]